METPTLLGHLARFASFSQQSELLCTQALAYLLQTHESAHSAMARLIAERTGVSLDATHTWRAEARQENNGRPDLEARDAEGVAIVKIEAKLGAEIGKDQVGSYVDDLQHRNDSTSAMLLLVPEARTEQATKMLAAALRPSGPAARPPREAGGITTAVLTWEELFEALLSDSTALLRFEVEQVRGMYRVLTGAFIAPLADEDDLRQWRTRRDEFEKVIDKVTRRLTTEHAIYPMSREPLPGEPSTDASGGYQRRYVCPAPGSCFSIGIRDAFAGYLTPVWMRFHKDTGNFSQIRRRIQASSVRCVESSGHIWIPLDVPLQVSGEQMVDTISMKISEIMSVSLGSR